MGLSEEQMDIIMDKYIMSLFYDLEDEVIADIGRRVAKTLRYTETAELMAKSMTELGYSASEIQKEVMKQLRADKKLQMEIAENTKAYKAYVQNLIDEALKDVLEKTGFAIEEAGNMAWNNDLSMWKEHGTDLKKPNTLRQLIYAFYLQTSGKLKNMTNSTGFKGTALGTTGVLQMYQKELDLALLKVASGTFSYDAAVNECIKRLAKSGLRHVDYASGRTYQLDTSVRMCVRTGMSQLAGKITEDNLVQTQHDLVITSQHIGSRPEHAPWQNKVFSYSGKSKKYPDFFKETGYGTPDGLKGINCTHNFYPFWEGASVVLEDMEEPKPVTVNGKTYTYYEATQEQRKMEREIRALKRERNALDNMKINSSEVRAEIRRKTAEYRSFSNKVNIRPKENRLRVIKAE